MLSRVRAWVRRLAHHRSTRITSDGFRFLLFTLAVGVAAINTGNNLFYLLLAMMLSVILLSGVLAEQSLRRLEFHRHLPDLLFVKESATATIVLKNGKTQLPSYSLRLLDVMDGRDIDRGLSVHQLLPGASRLLSYPIVAEKRGHFRVDGIRVVTSFPFGLFTKKAYYPIEGSTVVSPSIIPLGDSLIPDLHAAGHERQLQRRGHGSDLYNLRLYQSGDDSRNIHWITTARTSKLIVRETAAEDQRRATVYLATRAPATQDALFEQAVTFTASLVAHLAARGYHITLVVGTDRSSSSVGHEHIIHCLHTLALCERRDPGTEEQPDSCVASEEGASILVRCWDGSDDCSVHPTMVFDAARMASYVG